MKVLLAPDKFKGSLTAAEVVHHLGRGSPTRDPVRRAPARRRRRRQRPGRRRGRFPADADHRGRGDRSRGPTIAAFDGTTAVIEVANTCGLHTLPGGKLAPLDATSKGVGQAIVSLLRRGPSRVVLALGGSASTDGGAGMLAALGARFLDDTGNPIAINSGTLHRIGSIDTTDLVDLTGIDIIIASDVQNPLTGPDGAATVYGPQKGATPALVTFLDDGLTHLVHQLTLAGFAKAERFAATPGAGAAGGLGFAGLLLGGRTVSGADYFLDLLDSKHTYRAAISSHREGRMDDQTLHGKLPAIIARRAGQVPVIAVVGRSDISPAALAQMGTGSARHHEHTDGNPAGDPALSAQLLEEPADHRPPALATTTQHPTPEPRV